MSYRVLFLMLLALMFMVALAAGNTHAQSGSQSCDKTVCGPGYKPVLQSNGSCMCIFAGTNASGSTQPSLTSDDDCTRPEGCAPVGNVPR